MSRRWRLLLLAALWIALAVLGVRTYRGVERRLAAGRLCDAVAAGDFAAALSHGGIRTVNDVPGRQAVECRATALLATDAYDEAVSLLENALEDAGDWLPGPPLVFAVVAERRRRGHLRAAAGLVRRATDAYPDDVDLLYLELETRSELEAEGAVLDDLERRLPGSGKAAPLLGIRLAQRRAHRGELARADSLFGEAPPGDADLADEWYRARAAAYGSAADTARLAETCRRWVKAGGRPADVLAWHALTLSLYQLEAPDFPVLPMLEQAVRRREEIDPAVLEKIYYRLIGSLIVVGRHSEALKHFETASRDFDLALSRGDILRSAEQSADLAPEERRGLLRFVVEPQDLPGTLLLAADQDPVDQDFEPFEVPGDGVLEVVRAVGEAPQRWVYRNREGHTVASGMVWPSRASRRQVSIAAREPRPAARFSPVQDTGDGRRRVFTVILDCADWRLVQYLRARGELPVIDALVRTGVSAVLASRPPFTAAALDALVRPARQRRLSPFAALYQLGTELESNTFADTNPVGSLAWLLPKSPTLFETLGEGEHRVLNLLFSGAYLGGGRHGESVGPRGEVRRFDGWRMRRSLEDTEAVFFSSRRGQLREVWTEGVAAAFDAAYVAVERPEVDLLLLRVDPLDLATHALFVEISETGQDDGDHALYDLYRYIDHRLGELFRRIDDDDVLVVMSDHGIRTATEHDWRSLFVAVGAGLEAHRLAGTPHLRGVPRLLAELLEIETEWPQSGVEAVAAGIAFGR